MTDILDPSALLSTLPTLLPSTSKRLLSPHDGITSLIHSIMATLGFRLIGVDDTTPAVHDLANVLPSEWNKNGPSHYALRYKHDQSSLEFLIKITKLGPRTLINAIPVESDKMVSLDISTNDFISPSFYPSDRATSAVPLVNGFISSNRVSDLVSQFKVKIIQSIMPGIQKDGYMETPDPQAEASTSVPRFQNPAASREQPRVPRPEGDIPYRLPSHFPPQNPLEIGRRDLEPGGLVNPFSPLPLFPANSGDGMIVGPNHPMFNQNPVRGIGGPRGPWGGDGFLPPIGAPPGARFDPVGPGFGLGGPGRRNPSSRNVNDPDNDEFMPPGAGDMYM